MVGELEDLGARHRHYYQLEARENCPDSFTHVVTGEGADRGWVLHDKWVDLDPLPDVARYIGSLLHRVV